MAHRDFARSVGRLTVLNLAVGGLGLASGTLQARGLGPEGRGELAAIVVPLYFAGWLGDLGLGLYARREAGRSPDLARLLGTMAVSVVLIGMVLAVALQPLAAVLAQGRSVVRLWLAVGLLFLPLNLLGALLVNVAFGLERWELWIRSRLILSVGWLVALAGLYLAGLLTVPLAAASLIVVTLASYGPLLPLLARRRSLRFDARLARSATPFAAKAWFANLTNLANTRLDQLLMAGLVSSRELGLYVVAVTLAGLPSHFSAAVGLCILPRVVRDEEAVVPRAVRITLVLVVATSALIALAAWPFVEFVVGERFSDALPMVWVLAVAEVPLAGSVTLGQAFIGGGHPGRTAIAQGLALAVTVVGLVVLLEPLGGLGAALVSLAAYSLSFAYLVARAPRTFGQPFRRFLVPTGEDLRWAREEVRRRVRSPRAVAAAAPVPSPPA